MKKKTLILQLMFLLILVSRVNSQNTAAKGSVIKEIDFSNLQNKYKFPVPHGSPVKIRIKNVNRMVFKVEDEKSEEDFNIALPDALKGIKLPNFLFSLPIPAPETGANLPTDKASSISGTDLQDPEASLKYLLGQIERRAKKLNDATLYYNDINHLSKNCSKSMDDIMQDLNGRTISFLYPAEKITLSNAELRERLKDTLFAQREGAALLVIKIKEIVESYKKGMNKMIDDRWMNTQHALNQLRRDLTSTAKITKEKQEVQAEIDSRVATIEVLKSKKEELREVTDEMNENLKKAESLVDAMFEFDKNDKLYIISIAFSTFSNLKNYEYLSATIIPERDETKINITITAKELNACSGADKESTEIKLRAQGSLKVDISSGAFVSGGSEGFLGRTYYYEKKADGMRQIVAAKRNHPLMLSAGALIHFYRRSSALCKVAGSAGVSTTAGFDELNFHAGPSLILGDKNRFIISAGLVLKSSKVLDRQLQMNTLYKVDQTPDDIPTVAEFPKAGWFVGFTYNVSVFK